MDYDNETILVEGKGWVEKKGRDLIQRDITYDMRATFVKGKGYLSMKGMINTKMLRTIRKKYEGLPLDWLRIAERRLRQVGTSIVERVVIESPSSIPFDIEGNYPKDRKTIEVTHYNNIFTRWIGLFNYRSDELVEAIEADRDKTPMPYTNIN